jgi:hypothetical protein
MAAVIAQEIDVVQLFQPFGIVGHDGVRRAVAEGQEAFEHAADAGLVGIDGGLVQHLALAVLAGWIADLGGAAAHQRDWLAAMLLQPAQHHDRHQVADMKRRAGQIEAHIGDEPRLRGARVDRVGIRQLVDVAPARQGLQKFALVGHGGAALGAKHGV